jgi:plasmid rolling circle replication initiator protein Rep
MIDHNADAKILQDVGRDGREEPWRPKKERSLDLSESFFRLSRAEDESGERRRLLLKAERVRDCGTWLDFGVGEDGSKSLLAANFCKVRLCPMCAWRRSLRVFGRVSDAMDALDRETDAVPVFLTLTMRNCAASELGATLDSAFAGWSRLTRFKGVSGAFELGWFRALEVTRNRRDGTYHPHFHAIALAGAGYFGGGGYVSTREWSALWRRALRADYGPVCHVRRIRADSGRKPVAEVAKYTVKDSDYLFRDRDATDATVSALERALKGRRLYAFGGELKRLAKATDAARGDPEGIRSDLAEAVIRYRWSFGLGNYIRSDRRSGGGI